ncbi:hypothetical protein F4803DRAFT_230211 [Xylaria telfairii]|nr:hypothetical protein F4803DRAFT_230211 [Xylaria telfairii]
METNNTQRQQLPRVACGAAVLYSVTCAGTTAHPKMPKVKVVYRCDIRRQHSMKYTTAGLGVHAATTAAGALYAACNPRSPPSVCLSPVCLSVPRLSVCPPSVCLSPRLLAPGLPANHSREPEQRSRITSRSPDHTPHALHMRPPSYRNARDGQAGGWA